MYFQKYNQCRSHRARLALNYALPQYKRAMDQPLRMPQGALETPRTVSAAGCVLS